MLDLSDLAPFHSGQVKIYIYRTVNIQNHISCEPGVEIPCSTCPTWSLGPQVKNEIYIYLSLIKYKGSQYILVFHILINDMY